MEQNRNDDRRLRSLPSLPSPLTPLARLVEQMADRPGPALLWERLDMGRIARRLIQTARVAAGEHALLRAEQVIRRQQASAGRPQNSVPGEPAGGKPATV